ncbi:hypothetical protein [Brevundimonas goettingensis]|uniref:Uncharacterized protein n=1 Tax=Brevundimonas goettingensis TaxID=2774190 RepID=A0A975BYR2_9CAUL|nr:hypothetical protein [Brevundimonas goettingensis]QTC90166.1 hypothetical protein IFJ75_12850 [Brevundimonas goettingensis]
MSDAVTPTASSPSDESDLAYLRRLAGAGRGEPAPFLLLMAVFGGAYGFAIVAILLGIAIEGFPGPGTQAGPLVQTLNLSIFAAHLLFLGALIWTVWRTFGPRRVRLSRAATATWSAAFIAMVTTVVGFRIFTQDQLPTDAVYASYMLPPVLLTLWGAAWWVTAILNDRRWLLLVAVGSFGAAIAMAIIGNSPPLLPLSAACLLLLAFLPAVILMRQRAR